VLVRLVPRMNGVPLTLSKVQIAKDCDGQLAIGIKLNAGVVRNVAGGQAGSPFG
jgi:hypothetical protein